jgi:hypothetical protein
MSTPRKTITILRPTNNADHEVRVIHALYPQECVNTHTQPLTSASVIQLQETARTYQNTGVQTLPPPNGKIYTLIYGREPTQADIKHNMGVAAIGRYERDPRSNPFELLYGATYLVPLTRERSAYVDSAFQTANHDTSKMALAKAKVKASMTANKYRRVAAQAGYIIHAESKDEMIVHSEQYVTTVQFDSEGNLVNGSIKGRYLPNIHGTSLHPEESTPTSSRTTSASMAREASRYTTLHALVRDFLYPSPSHPPTIAPQDILNKPPTPHERILPITLWFKDRNSDSHSAGDDEYGRVGSGVDDFVIFDGAAASASSAPTPVESSSSFRPYSGKREFFDSHYSDSLSKRPRVTISEALHESSTPTTPLADSPIRSSHQHRDSSTNLSTRDLGVGEKPSHRPRLRPGDAVQERTLRVAHTSSKVHGGSRLGDSTTTSVSNEKVPRYDLSARPASNMANESCHRDTSFTKTHNTQHHNAAESNRPRAASSVQRASQPSIPAVASLEGYASASPKFFSTSSSKLGASSRVRKRSPSAVSFQAANTELDNIPARFRSEIRERENGFGAKMKSNARRVYPVGNCDGSPDYTRNSPNDSRRLVVVDTERNNRTVSGRVDKKANTYSARKPRQPFVLYVPPAMRVKTQQASNDQKVRGKGGKSPKK